MKHIILIGYKSVGKSAIGRELAMRAGLSFIDLDDQVEKLYVQRFTTPANCRQIMQNIGPLAFRELEHEALEGVLKNVASCVISLGGGTPLLRKNKILIKKHTVIQITAPKNIVFERIMINGKPAFFPAGEQALVSFNRTWADRAGVYDALATIKVENSGSLDETVRIIKEKMN